MEAGALLFSQAARRLGAATRAAGLVVPAFRCPPRVGGALRTIRRYPGGALDPSELAPQPREVDVDRAGAQRTAAAIAGEGGAAEALGLDVRDTAAVAAARERLGTPDVLVVTPWYPTAERRFYGGFVTGWVNALQLAGSAAFKDTAR